MSGFVVAEEEVVWKPPSVPGTAVFDRGPMDGREHPIEDDTAELCVVMTDGQQHHYARTNETRSLPDGRRTVVFEWVGRYYGPT